MVSPRALVTGASGFIGSYLVPHLAAEGFEIWASSRRLPKRYPRAVHWIRADITRREETFGLIHCSRPDYVFHLAGFAVPQESLQAPEAAFKLNVGGTIHLLEGLARFARRARAVLMSTSHVYGRSFFVKSRLRENDLKNPLTPYGASKLLMEMSTLEMAGRDGLDIVIARAFNHIGAGQPAGYVFSNFARQIALMEQGRQPKVLKVGELRLVRDFIPIRDAVRAYVFLARHGKRGEIYNVGTGQGIRLSEGLDFLRRRSRVRFKIKQVPDRLRIIDFPVAVGDNTKLRRLGWRSRESVREALGSLLEDWRRKVRRGLV